MIEILLVVLGVFVGYNIRDNVARARENRTVEQVDAQLRADLTYAKNLNQSLMQDVRFLRDKIARMKDD